MKRYFAAAALVVSSLALPNANANSIIFNFSSGSESGTVKNTTGAIGTSDTFTNTSGTVAAGTDTLTAYGYKCGPTANSVCAGTSNPQNASQNNAGTATLYDFSNNGLGIANSGSSPTANQIENTYFVQVDFSSIVNTLKAAGNTITGITVYVNQSTINTGWVLYGSNSDGKAETNNQYYAPLTSAGFGTQASYSLSAGQINTLLSGQTVETLSISGAANCNVELTGLEIDYSAAAPEPGTLVLMGGALLGLGVAGKKLRRRA